MIRCERVASVAGPRSPASAQAPRGNFYGTGLVGAVDAFEKRYGRAAVHAVAAMISQKWPGVVSANAPTLGILGAKKYGYAFVGDLGRAMVAAVHAPDEDVFIREVVGAGVDTTLNTVGRIVLRYAVSPDSIIARGQESWDMFHDAGSSHVVLRTENEYVVELRDWPNHDVMVCKICLEARRRVWEKTGVRDLEMRRERCQAWGHESCAIRVRWRT